MGHIFGRYLAGQILRPMLTIVLLALAVLLAERTLRVVDIVVGWRGGFAVFFEMLGYLVPHYMTLALPAAFFIGVLMTVSRLSRDGEIDAMLTAGLSLVGLLRPLFLIALVVLVVSAALLSFAQPYSRYAYRAAMFALSDVTFQALIRPNRFITLENTTYQVAAISPDRRSFERLFLFSNRPGGDSLLVTAETGEVVAPDGAASLDLDLHSGIQQFVPTDTEDGKPRGGAVLRFRDFTTDLRGAEPEPFRLRGEDEGELTLLELWRLRGQSLPDIGPAEIAAELHGRLARIVSVLILPIAALPLGVVRRRAKRSYGLVGGIVLLLAFNQLLQFGEALVDDDQLSPLVGIWLPVAAFFVLSLILLWQRGYRVPRGGASRIDDVLDGLIGRVRRATRLDRTAERASS